MNNCPGIGRLRARLLNWGVWLNWEAEIGPAPARCISLESRYLAEAGDVFEDEAEPPMPVPNVTDAEVMEAYIRQLEHMEQYCLAVVYGGMPSVMRFRRVGEYVMEQMIANAEANIYEMMKKRA